MVRRRQNEKRVENTRWVEAVEAFHTLYIPDGPYKSNVPRLVGEIVSRLEGDDDLKHRLLSEFGRRGAAVREMSRAQQAPVGSVTQYTLWEE